MISQLYQWCTNFPLGWDVKLLKLCLGDNDFNFHSSFQLRLVFTIQMLVNRYVSMYIMPCTVYVCNNHLIIFDWDIFCSSLFLVLILGTSNLTRGYNALACSHFTYQRSWTELDWQRTGTGYVFLSPHAYISYWFYLVGQALFGLDISHPSVCLFSRITRHSL